MFVRYIDDNTWDFDHGLGKLLREIRNKNGYSLRDIEDMTNIKSDRLARIERGDGRLSTMDLMTLSKVYDVSIVEILKDFWHLIEVSD